MSSSRETHALNLLLLLSALLSAITGIGASRGDVVPASAVCASAGAVCAARNAVCSIAHRPLAAPLTIVEAAIAPTLDQPVWVRAEPLFASRRRE